MRALLFTRRTLAALMVLALALTMGLNLIHAQEGNVLVIGHAESTDSLDPCLLYTSPSPRD